ncbi:MAG: agmatine deiminase family protein [Candidatus Riflebacteria bacterium]|nr:agmatine deiminase family protein [Candidatus Riflebacteria bacterium]
MKHLLLALALALALSSDAQARDRRLAAPPADAASRAGRAPARTASLPASLTPTERKYLREHFADYLKSKLSRITERAPENVVAAPAEFESAEGVLFSWSGYTTLLKDLIKEVAQDAKAFVVVESASEEKSVRQELTESGVRMENVRFSRARTNSVWIRDYGPWWIQTSDGDREIIDLVYNRPRPSDDQFPAVFGPAMGIKVHPTKLILAGGNLILDGTGVAIMTDVVFDASEGGNPNMSREQLDKYMRELFGCHKVIVLKKMNEDGTGHVDMFCKLLNENTFIVAEYARPGDGASGNYEILNGNARVLASETNGKGEPYKVFRIPMPRYDGTSYTHTNSLIVNDTVLVPIYAQETDEPALEVYRKLMPGHKVVGFDCNDIIGANGAIHCITKLVMSDPLEVVHSVPRPTAGQPIVLEAKVSALQPLDPSKLTVQYRAARGAPWQTAPMTLTSDVDGVVRGQLPALAAGSTLEYFLRVEDTRGMHETSPEDASDTVFHSLQVAPAAR